VPPGKPVVAAASAREQDDDLGDDQDRRRDLDQEAEKRLDRRDKRAGARGLARALDFHPADGDLGDFDVSHI
jgi:hypothetical protein